MEYEKSTKNRKVTGGAVRLVLINIIYPQTEFFVKGTNFSMQGFDFSWNLHIERERIDFSCGSVFFVVVFVRLVKHQNFEQIFDRFLLTQRKPKTLHRSMRAHFCAPERCLDLKFVVWGHLSGAFTLFIRKSAIDRPTNVWNPWLYSLFVAFILRSAELFFRPARRTKRPAVRKITKNYEKTKKIRSTK